MEYTTNIYTSGGITEYVLTLKIYAAQSVKRPPLGSTVCKVIKLNCTVLLHLIDFSGKLTKVKKKSKTSSFNCVFNMVTTNIPEHVQLEKTITRVIS